MPWSDGKPGSDAEYRRKHALFPLLVFSTVLVTFVAIFLSGAPEEKRISVYSTAANYSATVFQRNGVDYVGVFELLEPLGSVSAKANGDRWKFRYNDLECGFQANKPTVTVRGTALLLTGTFLLENGRGFVPVSSLGVLLPRILGGPITFNQPARRLFIGNVGVHFTAQIADAKLVMSFSSPVNPAIATEPGKLRMTFTHEPVVAPGSQVLTFDSKTIPSASFQESNGAAEIVVNSTSPVMASFSNDGRTITIAPPALAVQAQKPTQAPSPTPASPVPTTTVASVPAPTPQHVFAIIDAAHGGDERGAALTDQLPEKDVTLAFARRLREELIAHGLTASLLRDGDTTIGLDQRAAMANSSGAAIYISVHAAADGGGVNLYGALLSQPGENHGVFLDWETAQAQFRSASQNAENGVAGELRNSRLLVRALAAPLRPLNNIAAPAIAVEISAANGNVSQLISAEYQHQVAGAIAAGLVDVRDQLQVQAK
ncbi:MAG TPA: N-acetylmuramoyl-L-alanine amidase [Terriglobales bacterium]|nr:N-acetylmuramoyl-L-alanine amidase [Terriglobales bacterium]